MHFFCEFPEGEKYSQATFEIENGKTIPIQLKIALEKFSKL